MREHLKRLRPVAAGLALLPLAAFAALTPEQVAEVVAEAQAAGNPPESILETLQQQGMSLEEAVTQAVSVAGGGELKARLARAGICSSGDIAQAEAIGNALYQGADSALSDSVSQAVADYVSTSCNTARGIPRSSPGEGAVDPIPGSPA
ncbi:hypothetical protein E4634_12550 [Mangrovimicrobium sediminis]|uniref:Uncharacterized protein n=1 Tax=Mangrovimicrobium sediminis TaxID=2562682 RepID=A0A4Z0M107_9GAMM|nr:hypothetical protein [Haliea sp. SAOS-164]TGD73104.1 hypothetical protein E4634_12550 [Haliea sp. SAOS-164]